MLQMIRRPLTYANVMSTIAAFGVLATGGAYAASKIGPKDIKKNAVRAEHVKKNQIKARHIAKNAVARSDIRDGAVTEAKLADGIGNLQGPAGPKGDQGPTGDQGPAGPRGDSGFQASCNEGLAAGDVMVRVGSVCIDRYEASIWTARSGGTQITGAIPCDADGQNCDNIFARSVAGVVPRADITWFQAQQALANSGKRMPTNAEWQMTVAGTTDGGPCNVSSGSVRNTGADDACKSAHGTNDMVGNLWEWVADWVPRRTCDGSWGGFSDDFLSICGAATTGGPGALSRGGDFENATLAGPFAAFGGAEPSDSNRFFGFRGAR
jgi:hypothetical protein